MVEKRQTLITAAGGNGTAIQVIKQPLARSEYELRGKLLGDEMEHIGAEQAGFLVLDNSHFEMSGGEFCGNASRAAAILFAEATGSKDVSFTVSGFHGTVNASVDQYSDNQYYVRCEFPGMPTGVQEVILHDGQDAAIVDLGGIVHVVIDGIFPSDPEAYRAAHSAITKQLKLSERDAVGVIWFNKSHDAIVMHPVVWVKAINTFFYEESCGSGTIAVGRVTNSTSIVQPTEKTISVVFKEGVVVLESEMEVVR
jgi:diaminopimelate epimerase